MSDVESIAEKIIKMKSGSILHYGKPREITSEIQGKVWECVVPAEKAEQYTARLNVSNLRNVDNKQTILRIISKELPLNGALQVEPNLEDLYLYYFKGGNE